MDVDIKVVGEYIDWEEKIAGTKSHCGLFLQVTSWGSLDSSLFFFIFYDSIKTLLKFTE